MAENISLQVEARNETGKGAARALRKNNQVPGIIYGGGKDPQAIKVKFNELLRLLKKGRFMSTLIDLGLNDKKEQVICRGVQKDVVKDLPTHIDFMRLSENASINLFIPIRFDNQNICPGIKKGGVLTVVRPEVELIVNAKDIPSELVVDLIDFEIGDTINISNIALPTGATTTITGRDFVIANIQAPSGLRSAEDEVEEGTEEDVTEEASEETESE
tara:strand:- start:511 stop:1161 length:651 start_codon:yes stop_codon:yes gene_type:complete